MAVLRHRPKTEPVHQGEKLELRFHDDLSVVDARQWNSLAGSQPFLQHGFLRALETTGCVGGDTGWQPLHATLEHESVLLAAMPLYLKYHSWGEYVFDWAWADASQRAGLPYYPKLLAGIPFTPVQGPRLLAINDEVRKLLVEGVLEMARQSELSGFHCLFPDSASDAVLQNSGLMLRRGVQFHWRNAGYESYDDFLASMNHDKRKKLKQERKKAAASGLSIVRKTGRDISEADWAFFTSCYEQTYREHRSTPYLNLPFFLSLGAQMADQCLMIVASDGATPVAAALNLFDDERLYGRYWGAKRFVPSLHFELCYHQGVEFAIERGLLAFEGGAQGEHKLARGFEPVETYSWHWIADERLSSAVERYLVREGQGVGEYIGELEERAPFRQADGEVV
jgi:predicted N-acyltransferase